MQKSDKTRFFELSQWGVIEHGRFLKRVENVEKEWERNVKYIIMVKYNRKFRFTTTCSATICYVMKRKCVHLA